MIIVVINGFLTNRERIRQTGLLSKQVFKFFLTRGSGTRKREGDLMMPKRVLSTTPWRPLTLNQRARSDRRFWTSVVAPEYIYSFAFCFRITSINKPFCSFQSNKIP
ncbi:MAG: hypothetical protein M2R45_03685 [Verrucomicrobia subdivision 3 bacterium]|nr:hypothetical protein [Limisphaerales bacterium]MCS1414968.1 hypothetical protein [Limisphaerales bacterium]